jgi:EF hand/EF-hand domain pair
MRKLYWIGAASAVTLTAAAFALPGAKPSKMDSDGNGLVSKAEAMSAADAKFAKMDANADGTINAADREAKVKAHFKEMDSDNNGAISEAEMMAAHQSRLEDRAEKHAARGHDGEHMGRHSGGHHGGRHGGPDGGFSMAMMKNADANGDLAVTQAEFRTAAEARFTKADTNKDGALSADEQKAARKVMRAQRDALPPPKS